MRLGRAQGAVSQSGGPAHSLQGARSINPSRANPPELISLQITPFALGHAQPTGPECRQEECGGKRVESAGKRIESAGKKIESVGKR